MNERSRAATPAGSLESDSPETAAGRWADLRPIGWAALADLRLRAHWAVQTVAAVGAALVDPAPDDSHRSMTWSADLGLLLGRTTRTGRRVGVRVEVPEIVVEERGAVRERLPLPGRTLQQALDWLAGAIDPGGRTDLALPDYEMPANPVADGAAFRPADAELGEQLRRWFADAAAVLADLAARDPRASAVRCWPHHFDIATLLTLPDGGQARTIGVGLSPGDGGVPRPYFYVSPWPYPPADRLPAPPPAGRWVTEGWVGALLDAEAVVAEPSAESQRRLVERFVAGAVAAAEDLLRRGGDTDGA